MAECAIFERDKKRSFSREATEPLGRSYSMTTLLRDIRREKKREREGEGTPQRDPTYFHFLCRVDKADGALPFKGRFLAIPSDDCSHVGRGNSPFTSSYYGYTLA